MDVLNWMEREPEAPATSFRDPNGVLFAFHGRIFRIVTGEGMQHLEAFLASQAAPQLVAEGSLARTTVLAASEKEALLHDARASALYSGIRGAAIVEHERIAFPSFPYEWPAEMLYEAATLTLRLAIDLLPEGLGLKDATPYNVLFRGPRPVFIDLLSFERRDPGDPVWLPYAQFVRTFLLPLLAARKFGMAPGEILLTHRDGLEPEEFYRWLGTMERLRPPALSLVSMPVWLGRRQNQDDTSVYQKKALQSPEKAQFIVRMLLNGLRKKLASVAPKTAVSSTWTDYMASNNNYTAEHFQAKEAFVKQCFAEVQPKSVLDVGCNTGHFSFLAARSGARVVAIDYDPVVAGRVWREAASQRLDVLPLVVNLTRPTPGVGWRNREWPSFLDRASGAFDAVLMLAVIHHMIVTERVPLNEIVDMAAELTSDSLIIEFVSPEDSMFRRLARGREELHRDLTAEVFERNCRRRFDIVKTQHLSGTTRTLYWMRRKTG